MGMSRPAATSSELSRYSRPTLWMSSRSSAYHSRTSVRIRSTSVDASATWPRKPQERHACLGERAPALPVVARLAGGDDVLPDVLATAVTRHHVIERQVVTALPAVLAGVVVTDEDFLTGHLHDGARTLHVVREADDRWRRKAHPLARDQVAVLLDDARLLLREEDHRPADVADVQRLEVEVEHEHVRVDYAHVPILRSERYDGVPMSAHSTPGQNGS